MRGDAVIWPLVCQVFKPSGRINLFIFISCPLFLIIFIALQFALSEINIATTAFLKK